MKYYVFKNSIGEEYLIPESNRKEQQTAQGK